MVLRRGGERTAKRRTKRPVVYGGDCPRLNKAQLAEFKRMKDTEREHVPCTIRLPRETLDWWKSPRGAGYTSAMAHVLDHVRGNAELLRHACRGGRRGEIGRDTCREGRA
ncbi:MAG: hypothetical protein MdMp014T_1589 [Treponematales bacterium]